MIRLNKTGQLLVRGLVWPALVVAIFTSCAPPYHIENYQAFNAQQTSYSTYQFILTDSKDQKQEILQALTEDFFNKLKAMGFIADSINPQLLFLIRWEEHLVGRVSSNTNNEVMPTYSITNPAYSPVENTSDKLTSHASAPQRIRYYDKESFIRIQAIDAIRNELIWSVKVYSHKRNELPPDQVPRITDDLVRSFSRAQFRSLKTDHP